ncbi:hypothetical protein LPJ73_006517 [Coemansia sp. RSA 2703]|nr:hypothetical protein LPJ73_006517 [Coemansia sp. RSA 2703]
MCAEHHSRDQHLAQHSPSEPDHPDHMDHDAQSVPDITTNASNTSQTPADQSIDPNDPATQRAAGTFGFTPEDLRRLVRLAQPSRPLVAELRGWSPAGILRILCAMPPSHERTFLAALLAIVTGTPVSSSSDPHE